MDGTMSVHDRQRLKLTEELGNHALPFLANQRSKLTEIEYKKDLQTFVRFLGRHAQNVGSLSELKKSDLSY